MFGPVAHLCSADLKALLDFVGDVDETGFLTPYPSEVVARVKDLVPCDDVTYQVCDLASRRFLALVGAVPEEGDDEEDNLVYWRTGPCPITAFRARTGSLDVVTMSDVIDGRLYHELPVFRDYFAPAGVDHIIDLALPAHGRQQRSFVLFRARGERDFSPRDRDVLRTLQPDLRRLETHAALRRQLSRLLSGTSDVNGADPDPCGALTAREREIVKLAGQGKTNAQIAAELWVAPSTVKKHLENSYAKLGVGGRTAAATRLLSVR
jgi:DNA-binding CsgD family transcriptional regulator